MYIVTFGEDRIVSYFLQDCFLHQGTYENYSFHYRNSFPLDRTYFVFKFLEITYLSILSKHEKMNNFYTCPSDIKPAKESPKKTKTN